MALVGGAGVRHGHLEAVYCTGDDLSPLVPKTSRIRGASAEAVDRIGRAAGEETEGKKSAGRDGRDENRTEVHEAQRTVFLTIDS